MSFGLFLIIGFIFGIGFGFFVQRAGLCFAQGLAKIYTGRGKRIINFFIIIFIITSIGFLISGLFSDDLGLKAIGQIRGYGFYNILAGIIFGAGILMNGGCILGTLRQMGEGNMQFLVVFLSFIPGMALVVYVIDPLIKQGYHIKKVLVPELLGIPPGYITAVFVILALTWWKYLNKKTKFNKY